MITKKDGDSIFVYHYPEGVDDGSLECHCIFGSVHVEIDSIGQSHVWPVPDHRHTYHPEWDAYHKRVNQDGYIKDTKDLIQNFLDKYFVTGFIEQIPNTSTLYGGLCFQLTLACEEQEQLFLVFSNEHALDYPTILGSIWDLSDEAENGEWDTYERWSKEVGDFYEHECGREMSELIYQRQHGVFTDLMKLLGKERMIELSELIRNGAYREREKSGKN